ncbi:hypothetical protein SAMN04488168_101516 [Bacillus sp. 491mf]|uniref:hypothetical protein n=1 Tax=unclassified Bacillus (in: firmicutes) TaxID=185979 RepID=UPI0005546266|nr:MULTISPECIES: hypothetical protein [unclassified Bacillus (in: firmicutes)]SFC03250.1 hypothetical protein SAMN04488168_101516 [Bacillus sp. 491mf]
MNKTLRVITIIGVLFPLMLIWSINTASQKEKAIFTVIQLSVGVTSIITLDYIFKYIKKKKESK